MTKLGSHRLQLAVQIPIPPPGNKQRKPVRTYPSEISIERNWLQFLAVLVTDTTESSNDYRFIVNTTINTLSGKDQP